jgi:hypothetical protein
MKISVSFVSGLVIAAVALAGAARADQAKPSDVPNKGETQTIRGVVRDLYCPMQNLGATAHDFDVNCAIMCLRSGSPLVIQTTDGNFYFPISDSLPDADQRPRLLPFAGKTVEATGVVRARGNVRAISISEIREVNGTRTK